MGLNLSKGGSAPLNLSKSGGNKYYIGLGWPHKQVNGKDIDLDVSALVLGADGQVLSNSHVLFYNQKNKAEGFADDSLIHGGDNRNGAGAGDDEYILIDLDNVDSRAEQITILVTMHEAPAQTTFKNLGEGTSETTFIRICRGDKDGPEEIRYTLADIAADANSLQFGSLMRDPTAGWRFDAIGGGGVMDLGGALAQFGVK